jgi:hypothetical protein
MSCWLKTLCLTFAVAAFSCLITSCGTSNQSQIRLIDAIPDGQQVDIYANGIEIVRSMQFRDVYPPAATPASYATVASGNTTIKGYLPGDTVNPIPPIGTIFLNGTMQYTVVAVGYELNDSPPLFLNDDNTAPPSNKVEIRIVNASISTASLNPPTGVDIYFLPPTITDLTNYTPQISNLGYGQASIYQLLDHLSSGYQVTVTTNGGKTAILTYPSNDIPANPVVLWPAAGSITTLVLLDNAGGNNGISTTPLVLNELN